MESVENGKITLDDEVTISERAASMGGSQMYMEVGETHPVRELMEGVAMASANDGCVALAEYVAGSEEIFVERMNARAKELGMVDTHFVNTNGLPVADHYSSAYDIAIMSMELYKHEETLCLRGNTQVVHHLAEHDNRGPSGQREGIQTDQHQQAD